MGFRTVVVNSRCKLEHRLNYLVVRGEKEKKIYINEINTIIVQSTAVSLTAALLCELVKNNVKIIFCDEKHNPSSELTPYYGVVNTSKRYKKQIGWSNEIKGRVWKEIIKRKIINQSELLSERGFDVEADMLYCYSLQVEDGDLTNREGHAAKVYFNCILPEGVSRSTDDFINTCLNYGYAVMLSAFNREIVAFGYFTQLGIWHDNEFNCFNLSCDLMEPFRVVVDKTALSLDTGDKEFKKKMVNILNYKVVMDDKNTTLDIAIRQYVKSVINALDTGDVNKILFPSKIEICNE